MNIMNKKQDMTEHYPKRLLGVFAHPDDESFCAGGTFASAVAHGAEVMVVSATRGEAGQIRSAGTATRPTLAHVREQELQHKIEAIAAHRSQFPIQPHMLPHTILQELMGQEYFVHVSPVAASVGGGYINMMMDKGADNVKAASAFTVQ